MAAPAPTTAAQRVFGITELLERILFQLSDCKAILKCSALSKEALEIIHTTRSSRPRYHTFLGTFEDDQETWEINTTDNIIRRVDPSHTVPRQLRQDVVVRKPIVLNPLLFFDHHYHDRHIAARARVKTELLGFKIPIETLLRWAEDGSNRSCLEMQVSAPPSKNVLIDWHWPTSGGYSGSSALVVHDESGVTVRKLLDEWNGLKSEGKICEAVTIEGKLFVSEAELKAVCSRASTVAAARVAGLTKPEIYNMRKGREVFDDPKILKNILLRLPVRDMVRAKHLSRKSQHILKLDPLLRDSTEVQELREAFWLEPEISTVTSRWRIDTSNDSITSTPAVPAFSRPLLHTFEDHLGSYLDQRTGRTIKLLSPCKLNDALLVRIGDIHTPAPDTLHDFHGTTAKFLPRFQTVQGNGSWSRSKAPELDAKGLHMDMHLFSPSVTTIFVDWYAQTTTYKHQSRRIGMTKITARNGITLRDAIKTFPKHRTRGDGDICVEKTVIYVPDREIVTENEMAKVEEAEDLEAGALTWVSLGSEEKKRQLKTLKMVDELVPRESMQKEMAQAQPEQKSLLGLVQPTEQQKANAKRGSKNGHPHGWVYRKYGC